MSNERYLRINAGLDPAIEQSPVLTIFAIPKPFVGHVGVIQKNAIRSWVALGPKVEVILLGQDAGVAEFAVELGVRHVADIESNFYGTPLLSSIMKAGEAHASAPYLCMANADIMFTSGFVDFIDRLHSLPPALYIGLRSDLDVTEEIDFSQPGWEQDITARLHREGRFRGAGDDSFNGTDYFIYPMGMYPRVPALTIGRYFFDSWLIADVRRRKLPVVDASSEILAIHQNHDYGHVKSKGSIDLYRYWINPEIRENHRLSNGFFDLMGPKEASHSLSGAELIPRPGNGLLRIRRDNFRNFLPIMLRGSAIFRSETMSRAWGDWFPFDSSSGRHHFKASGAMRWAASRTIRPVWKMLPAKAREFGHIARREPRRAARIVKWKLVGKPAPALAFRLENVSPVVTKDLLQVRQWLGHRLPELSGAIVVAPSELRADLPGAIGYQYFSARRHWHHHDIPAVDVILKRDELRRINLSALRVLHTHFSSVFRNDTYTVLSRDTGFAGPAGTEWPEIREILSAPTRPTADLLVVLNVWKRGAEQLRRQIEGLLEQTERPAEIIVCAFGVAAPKIYEDVVREFHDPTIQFVGSSRNFKYHGRFQIALGASATYVAFIDDDIMVGRDFLRRCRTVLETVPDAGDVGVYGWRRLPGPDQDGHIVSAERGEYIEHLPPERDDTGLVEADLLCGFHFLRLAHVKFMFRDELWTTASGEDFQLAFSLRKFAGLRSYLVPVEPQNPDTWGLSEDWLVIRDHATTVGDMLPIRDTQYWRLLNRGYAVRWMKEAKETNTGFVFAVFSTAEEAANIRLALDVEDFGQARPTILAFYCGSDRGAGEAAAEAFRLSAEDQIGHIWSWLDLELGREFTRPGDHRSRATEAVLAFSSLLDALDPVAFWIDASCDPIIDHAARIACHGRKTAIVAAPDRHRS